MIKRLAAVLSSTVVLTVAQLAVAAPASAQPAPPPCLIPGPGPSLCAGNVTFSSYFLSTAYRPIQGAPGAAIQPTVQINFNHSVANARAFTNDPDYSGNKAWVHRTGCCWIQLPIISGDGTPGVFTSTGPGALVRSGFDAMKFETDPTDYVNWVAEYQTTDSPSSPWCKVNAAVVTCMGTTATVNPFAQGSVFDPFQGSSGTGTQAPIDVTFEVPLAKVAVTAIEPDLAGNQMEAYAADGTLLGTASFTGDNNVNWTTVNTQSIAATNIQRIRLIAADNDYTVFQGITAWPMTEPPNSCTVNLGSGAHDCAGVPGISVLTLSGGRALLKLAFTPGYGQSATFAALYNAVPTGFTVNIGDSSTNDGGGGDGYTQSNDAELMVQNQTLTIYGRDGTPTYPLRTVSNLGLAAGKVASFEVRDRKVCWNVGTYTCLTSDWLYALNGQNDPEGPENYDIYAAFNQVITQRSDRYGTGVSSVLISLAVTR